ncbi:SIMPL domain-containing protein [Tessaracoccus flavus]|uniref:SIMPL domain-containing protein n=1 Tax=Tessaracoccus flavus TaxID=1610493 RepID=A0A1Q2CIE1_9ACTN|nr:SIMPL domain-containing protein [Tessaracoccus flavus]AQP45877.1 hypothetical protein RPIT_14555 [Tessaracoccus flavus]
MMQITVQGEATASFPPERATVHLELGFEGPDKAAALQRATQLANELGSHLERLAQMTPSPTTWSAILPIGTRSWRPHSNDGAVLPLRYAASCRAKVKFSDFRALAQFIDQWGGVDGVSVRQVEWTLTERAKRKEEEAVLARAVEVARARAQTIATAAGSGQVRVIDIADPGLLGQGLVAQESHGSAAMMRSLYDGGAQGDGVDLRPEDVDLVARVHARFTTD